MTLDELNEFIEERDAMYRANLEGKASDRERVLARMVKLAEEVGELSDEVLGSLGLQRQDKLDKHTMEKTGAEAADVIITTFLLAKSLGINLSDAVEKKMAVIRERWKK